MLKREPTKKGESSTSTREVGVQVKSTTVISLQKKVTTLNTETQTPNLANDDSYEAALLRGHPLPVRQQFRFYMNDKSRERKFQSMSDRFKEHSNEDDEDELIFGAEQTCIVSFQPEKRVKPTPKTAMVVPTVGGKPVLTRTNNSSPPVTAEDALAESEIKVQKSRPPNNDLTATAGEQSNPLLHESRENESERGVENEGCLPLQINGTTSQQTIAEKTEKPHSEENSPLLDISQTSQTSDPWSDDEMEKGDFTDVEDDDMEELTTAEPTCIVDNEIAPVKEAINTTGSCLALKSKDEPQPDESGIVEHENTDHATQPEEIVAVEKIVKKKSGKIQLLRDTITLCKEKLNQQLPDEKIKSKIGNQETDSTVLTLIDVKGKTITNHKISLSKLPPRGKGSSTSSITTVSEKSAPGSKGSVKTQTQILLQVLSEDTNEKAYASGIRGNVEKSSSSQVVQIQPSAGSKRKVEEVDGKIQLQSNESKNKKPNCSGSEEGSVNSQAEIVQQSENPIAVVCMEKTLISPPGESFVARTGYVKVFRQKMAYFNLVLMHNGRVMNLKQMREYMLSNSYWDVVVVSYDYGVLTPEEVVAVFSVYKPVKTWSAALCYIRKKLNIPVEIWAAFRQKLNGNEYYYRHEMETRCGIDGLDNIQWCMHHCKTLF